MFVVAKQAEKVFSGFSQISRFQILVSRRAQRDEMTLKIELKNEAIDKEKLALNLNKNFQSICLVKADKIEFTAKGTIPEEHKTIVDQRTWD
jgi:phenylacetate-coenzyme A ligase PaaK-like adenylate-forming protein